MKAVVKKEHVGEAHPVYGRLYANTVYEVEALGELFAPAPEEMPLNAEKENAHVVER